MMDDLLNELAADMFRTFARFEYAMKAAGFHNGDGAAEPNWRAFLRRSEVAPNTDLRSDLVLQYVISDARPPGAG